MFLVDVLASAPLLALAMTSDPDRELVERFVAGERAAFDQLVRRHQKGVWYLARRYVRHDANAADVTQQTFVRAFTGLAKFRGAASVRSWLYRIAIHCALSWLRDHRRDAAAAELADGDVLIDQAAGASAAMVRREDQVRLRAAVAELPPKQRLVVELRVFDDLAFAEVAELAECTENAAKVSFHLAVRKLRERLGAEGP